MINRRQLLLGICVVFSGITVHSSLHSVFNESLLETWAVLQDYASIREYIYNVESASDEGVIALEWVIKKAKQGHVPMMYFLVRHAYYDSSGYFTSETLPIALMYKIISLIRIKQDLACYCGPALKAQVYDIFLSRYDDWWFKYVTISPDKFQQALNMAGEWFKDKDMYLNFPSPKWVGYCRENVRYTGSNLEYKIPGISSSTKLFVSNPEHIRKLRSKALEESLQAFEDDLSAQWCEWYNSELAHAKDQEI